MNKVVEWYILEISKNPSVQVDSELDQSRHCIAHHTKASLCVFNGSSALSEIVSVTESNFHRATPSLNCTYSYTMVDKFPVSSLICFDWQLLRYLFRSIGYVLDKRTTTTWIGYMLYVILHFQLHYKIALESICNIATYQKEIQKFCHFSFVCLFYLLCFRRYFSGHWIWVFACACVCMCALCVLCLCTMYIHSQPRKKKTRFITNKMY